MVACSIAAVATIKLLTARQILDSRGFPTIEVDCVLDDGSLGRAAVPSGASTGSHEALELRDGDAKMFDGKSILKAVSNVGNDIFKALKGMNVSDHRTLDQTLIDLDGTRNKSKLGANAVLGVSMAACRARAVSEKQSLYRSIAAQYEQSEATLLPVPLMNVINGGKHADSGLSFQECMIVPSGFSMFSDALRAGAETFQILKKLLHDAGHSTSVGDEGGFAPRVKDSREAFGFLLTAIESAGYMGKIHVAIDAAASEFFDGKTYSVDGMDLSNMELVHYYEELSRDYDIVSIEDSHSEDDWDGFVAMQSSLGRSVQLVGDDLLVTNVSRIEEAAKKKAVNAVLIKLNQIGTVSETVDAILLARKYGWNEIVSHRSGETEDTFISHLAVGLGTGQIKTGSLSRTDRTAKYNELLRIEEELGNKAEFRSPFQK